MPRISALPMVMKCPASSAEPEIDIDTTTDEARMGTAVDDALTEIINKGLKKLPNTNQILIRNNIQDVDEFFRFVYAGLDILNQLREVISFEGAQIKVDFKGPLDTIRGTADTFGWTHGEEKVLVNLDWKLGYIEGDHRDQQIGYLHGGAKKYEWDGPYKFITVYLNTKSLIIEDLSRDDMKTWFTELDEAISSDKYSPGEHCLYCHKKLTGCPAHDAMTRSAATALIELPSDVPATKEVLGGLYDQAKLLRCALGAYDKKLKEVVKEFGEIQLEDGRVLCFDKITTKNIDLIVGHDVLAEHFGDAPGISELMKKLSTSGAIQLGKGKLEDYVGSLVAKGKGKAKIALIKKLEDVGAVTEFTYNKLVTRQPSKALTTEVG